VLSAALSITVAGCSMPESRSHAPAAIPRDASPVAAAPVALDPMAADVARRVVDAILRGEPAQSCTPSLCTDELTAELQANSPTAAAPPGRVAPTVVYVRAVYADDRAAQLDAWVQDPNTDGSLRSYRVTLTRPTNGGWLVAAVAP
jgi:hypothetical protein